MAKKRRTYKITIEQDFLPICIRELYKWQVNKSLFTVKNNTIITQNTNVVDIATETFITAKHLINIETI